MDNNLLKELKEKYNNEMCKKNEVDKSLKVLNKRKVILENSPIVRDYIELMDQIESLKYQITSEEEILNCLMTELEYRNDFKTNNIYCYCGTFIEENGSCTLVDENDKEIGYFDRYVDIESLCVLDNPVEDREVFEKENIVIRDKNLYQLHDDFITDCIKINQDAAVKKVLSRSKKNN